MKPHRPTTCFCTKTNLALGRANEKGDTNELYRLKIFLDRFFNDVDKQNA